MPRRWAVIGWLAPLAIMLLLVTSNVRLAASSLFLYEQLFERHHVPARTGIAMEGLRDVGRQIQQYFTSDTEPLHVTAVVDGRERVLFGPDEVSHMSDVKQLFLKTYRVQGASLLFLVVVSAAAIAAYRRRFWVPLARWMRRGALLTGLSIGAIGIASLVAFDQVFLLFHYLGFPQGNFLFDTRTDYLVRVFPIGFWEDMTLFIGVLTLAEAAVLYVVGTIALHAARRETADRSRRPARRRR